MKKIFIAYLCLFNLAIFSQETIPNTIKNKPTILQTTLRPSISEPATTMPSNTLQVSLGFNYEKSYVNNFATPTAIIQYGINENYEMRINIDAGKYENNWGLKPISMGLKIKMVKGKKYGPSMSFLGGATINKLATKNLQTTYIAPNFTICMDNKLPKNFSLAYSYGINWNGETPLPTYGYTFATNYTYKEKLLLFIELYGYWPQGQKFDQRMDFGLAYVVKPNFLIDFQSGFGITKISPDFYISTGLTFRLPKKEKQE